MASMFEECKALETLDLSNFNTTNVKSMYDMFSDCSSLKNLNISKFDTTNVYNMSSMFSGCSSLNSIIVDEKNQVTKVTNYEKHGEIG